ncbi:MAG: TonB-dependent receptor [Chitinophagaceae bacterium]|uniref:TonB-dependent receptor n=1 Tax=unclassified Paraflavitalea TaxID=2798305 RepID=UPI003D347E14|nr:TonB-dependent receptor [Chitinophagaceae bacterium]
MKFIFTITLLLFSTWGWSQSGQINCDYNNTPFVKVVTDFETQSGFRFFYQPGTIDSIPVTLKLQGSTLEKALDKIFENGYYQFFIDKDAKRVYILDRKTAITTSLPKNYFTTGTNKQVPTEPSSSGEEAKKEAVSENKLIEIGSKTSGPLTGTAIVAGYVRDFKNGEGLSAAAVFVEGTNTGVITDGNGYFSITLPKGRKVLLISSTGMKSGRRELMIYGDGKLVIELKEDVPTLKTVVVVAEKNSNVRRMQMGLERLSIKTIKQSPALLGEPDVLRVLLTLPGVTSVGEASTGFNVRGGSTDQNLVLFNEATIYNPSHVFGFFSAFNPDVLKNAELYKSSIPERFGSRLSSVLDITTRDGNTKRWSGSAGIGLLTSKISLEGPILSDKTSVLMGARTTYSNWILKRLPNETYKRSSASFYDANITLTHNFNSKNSLQLTGYISDDGFRLGNDTTYNYGNKNAVLKYKHIFNNKLSSSFTAGIDQYYYKVAGDEKSVNGYQLSFGLTQQHARLEFVYTPNNKHQFNWGAQVIQYAIQPGKFEAKGDESLVVTQKVADEQGREWAVYLGDKINVSDKISIQGGIRFSGFANLGPKTVFNYVPGLPRDESTIVDSVLYRKNKPTQTYAGPEFRFAFRYTIDENSSIKLGYNSLRQYLHLLTNTTAISPTDIWKLSDPYIKPQTGDQVSFGFYRNLKNNMYETSFEIYYKRMNNFLDYKSGAQIVLNQHIERDIINTKGIAYGAEFMIKKTTGKLNGWISYTYSRVKQKMDDPIAGQQINKGQYYPANFDKPHAFNAITNYKFTHRFSMSLNVQYSTGRPITLPIAVFNLAGSQRVFYSERNQYRIPNYFRADFSLNIDGNHKVKQRFHNSWALGLYNMTGRKNPYSIYFIEDNGVIKGYKLSVIGTAIPYITFNIRF